MWNVILIRQSIQRLAFIVYHMFAFFPLLIFFVLAVIKNLKKRSLFKCLTYLVKFVIFYFIFNSIGNVHVQYYKDGILKRSFDDFLNKNVKINVQRKWWHLIFCRCEIIIAPKIFTDKKYNRYHSQVSDPWMLILNSAPYFLILQNKIHWIHHYRSKNLVKSDSFVDVNLRKWPKMQRINVDVW